MLKPGPDERDIELQSLRERLAEAEEILGAIRAGEIDALIVNRQDSPAIYTLQSADSPYRLLVEQMHEGALTLSGDGIILYCNPAFARLVGMPSDRLRGSPLAELVENPAQPSLAKVIGPTGVTGLDLRLRISSGEIRHVYVSSAPLAVDGERVHCVLVTDLTRHGLRLRHDAIVNSSADAIYSLTPDGIITTWNRSAEDLYGYKAHEIVGCNVSSLFPVGQKDSPELGAVELAQGKTVQHETVRISKSGQQIAVALSTAMIESADGRPEGISVIARDITERKRAQDHLLFLLRETSHRSKNLLAVVQAIAAQTARSTDTIEEFESRLMQRLHGISASHDLFVEENWERVNLAELVRRQLKPFVQPGPRLRLEGPSLFVTPEAAQNLGFAVHELTTNAVKYGALSGFSGYVAITWILEGSGADQRLRFSWREHDGPRVTPPPHAGFGSTVINKLVVQSLNAELATDFSPEGFWWELMVPADQIVVTGSPPAKSL